MGVDEMGVDPLLFAYAKSHFSQVKAHFKWISNKYVHT